MPDILEVKSLTKTYQTGSKDLTVLNDVTFQVAKGERVAIVGTSGSGKTTLLGLCAGLDLPTHGSVNLCGESLTGLTEDDRARIRNLHVGFIFQDFQLVPTLTALENVTIPLELRKEDKAFEKATALLERVGLGDRLDHYPNQLSGGEQQRVALARAFSNAPDILFADEPTGNLDEDTSAQVEKLLFELNEEEGTTLVVVTHDLDLARRTGRVIRLKGGHLVGQKDEVIG